jgi:hypothetical protein
MVGIGFSSLARAGRRAAFRQITPDSLSRATSSQAINEHSGQDRLVFRSSLAELQMEKDSMAERGEFELSGDFVNRQ